MHYPLRERHRGGRRRGPRAVRTLPQEINGHHCHAYKCQTRTQPKKFMCALHWSILSKALQDRLVAEYRPGQEIDKRPSTNYMLVAHECIRYICKREHPRDYMRLRKLHESIERCYDKANNSLVLSAT